MAAAVQNRIGELLVCERADVPGAWQFPQGGVKDSETLSQALMRELQEEIGLTPEDYEIRDSYGPYRYLFPNGKQKRGYDGQEQTVFRVVVHKLHPVLSLDHDVREFRAAKWIRPDAFRMEWVPEFKQALYKSIFRDLFNVSLLPSVNSQQSQTS